MEIDIWERVAELEKRLDVSFKDKQLLLQAITHCSYLNEHRGHPVGSYERMEYLGDSILEMIVADRLYHTYPEASEGNLTRCRAALVSGTVLGEIGQTQLELHHFVLSSKGDRLDMEDLERLRSYTCACVFEAIVGAVYLDRGLGECRMIVDNFLLTRMRKLMSEWRDDKADLQDLAQKRFGLTPRYKVLESNGPDHRKKFRVGCYLGEVCVAEASGPVTKETQKSAARLAIETITLWEGRITETKKVGSIMRRSRKHGGNQ